MSVYNDILRIKQKEIDGLVENLTAKSKECERLKKENAELHKKNQVFSFEASDFRQNEKSESIPERELDSDSELQALREKNILLERQVEELKSELSEIQKGSAEKQENQNPWT